MAIKSSISDHNAIIKSQKEFSNANAAFWESEFPSLSSQDNAEYILVRVEDHAITNLCNASLGAMIASIRKKRLLFLVKSSKSQIIPVLKSYPQAEIVYLDDLRHHVARKWAILQAEKIYNTLKRKFPADLLDFKIDGIRFGDVVYDSVLAQGYATIDKIDRRILPALRDFFYHRYIVKYLRHRYNISSCLFAHTIGSANSALSRYFLKYGIEVIARVGAYQFTIKKYQSLDDVWDYPGTPERKFFQKAMADQDGKYLKEADDYLESRFEKKINHPAVDVAFDKTKKMYQNRDSFCNNYGLDPSKPIVFVMLHAFNDYPHSHFRRRMIFTDYYHWFINTLQIAKQVRSVNWIFKQHPVDEKYYKTQDLNLKQLFQQIREDNILLFSSDEDFNAQSIRFLADVLITCIGTAGMEYSAYGIPCILGGESPYSGFGFAIEPEDRAQYETYLQHIHDIPKLTDQQVKTAKTVAYLYFCAIMGSRYHFCPYFDDNQLFNWADESECRLWSEAAQILRTGTTLELIKKQIYDIGNFIQDPLRTQYIDQKDFCF
jgi:hypothetical protein